MSGLPETGHDLQPADGRAERHRRRAQPVLPPMSVIDVACGLNAWRCRQRHPHRIEAELISALAMGTNLDVAAADQSRPRATRAAKLINPMRRIFIPHLGKMGFA